MTKKFSNINLFVTDIDNTVFDWVSYYVPAFTHMLEYLSKEINVSYDQLAKDAQDVFVQHGSIEYPFVVQELKSVEEHFQENIDEMLAMVDCCRSEFMKVGEKLLKPYKGVKESFKVLKKRHPKMPIVALTDAPRYVAMWKLNKLGLLDYFDAVYGLADPMIPTSANHGRIKVDPEILNKHLQKHDFGFKGKVRILPDEYEKPGNKGLKMVLIDYEMDELHIHRENVLWCGDNQKKDIKLGKSLGVNTVWAEYGTDVKPEMFPRLEEFSPPQNIHKNINYSQEGDISHVPDASIKQFSDILELF